jgi:uncharacterized protein GlcG (DUF336 family)
MKIKLNLGLLKPALFPIFFLLIFSISFNTLAEEKAYITTRILTSSLAQQAAVTTYDDCTSKGYQVTVAVVDRRGELMAFIRNPLASPHTIEVSQRKAYTAATYQTPSSQLMDSDEFKFTPGVLLLGGGLPIRVAGHFYGAIGVSGAPGEKVSGDTDEVCAQAGLDAIAETLEFSD